MNGELVRIGTSDNGELQGLLFDAKSPTVVMHLHGIWGNFYANPFIDHFARFYAGKGLSFLTVNTRDHDGGAMQGEFTNCLEDIDSILSFTARRNYQQVLIQGHSLGALKAVYYMAHAQERPQPIKVTGLILLSPFDNIAFYSSNNPELRAQHLVKVQAIAERDPRALIPADVWDMWMLSAHTYLELVEDRGNADIFPFRLGTLKGTAVTKVGVPVFAAVGGNDFAASPSSVDEYRQLTELQGITAVVVDGAPHNFAGREEALLSELQIWLDSLSQ